MGMGWKVLNDVKPYLAMVLLQVGFAGMYIIAVASLKAGMSHFVLVVYRNLVATAVMTPFALYFERGLRPKMTITIFIKVMGLAFLEPVMDQNLYFMGAKLTSAGFATALVNILPAVTFMLALILRMEKVRLRSLHSQAKIAGTVLTVAGAVLMVLYHGPILQFPWTNGQHHATASGQGAGGGAAARDWLNGTIMVIIACVSWACFFILQSNTLRSYPAELSLTVLICGMGSLHHLCRRRRRRLRLENPSPMATSAATSSFPSYLVRTPASRRSGARPARAAAPAAAEGVMDVVSEAELREKGFMGMRKTKLVCTVGPACVDALPALARGGMGVARVNLCHGGRDWHRAAMREVRRLNDEEGFCVSLMVDTEGSQLLFADHGGAASVKAEDCSEWLFTSKKTDKARPFTMYVNFDKFSEGILVGDELVIDGGMATFEVTEKIGSDLRCKCTDPGLLLPRAKLSFWRDGKLVERNFGLPTLSTKDWADIEFGITEGVDCIALSFVKDANDIKSLKTYLSRRSLEHIKIFAKIESLESLKNLKEIVEASDGVMVARGDLGVQIPLEQIPAIQEAIVELCRNLNKPVIVASQLLESMVEYPTPTRAEVADVSEAVRQYADAIMLSAESAIGAYPEKALSVLRAASERMESWSREENMQRLLPQYQLAIALPDRISEQICTSAVEMANNLAVDAIFVYTKHGHMASLLSRNRPNPPIFAFTDDANTRKSMNLYWGVIPLQLPLSNSMDDNFKQTIKLLKSKGSVKPGDSVLVVADSDLNQPCAAAATSVYQSIQVRLVD